MTSFNPETEQRFKDQYNAFWAMRQEVQRFYEEALQKWARAFIGESLEDAQILCDSIGVEWRVSKKDGKGCIITHDMHPCRLNFHIVDEKISAVEFG